MFTFTKLDFASTLPLIGEGKRKIVVQTEHGIIKVSASSKRLNCFSKNHACVTCYRKGSVFLVQSHKIKNVNACKWCIHHKHFTKCHLDTPHINMYHVENNGQLILMTRDHIIPSCKGGKDTLDNLHTMCSICNTNKSYFSFEDFVKHGCQNMEKLSAAGHI